MKIIIVTSLWKRYELNKIILPYYKKFDVYRLAVGSEGNISKQIAEDAGWDYIEHPNRWLSQKFTAVFQKAREYNPDAVLLIGSDDLLSAKLINYYQNNYDGFKAFPMGLKDLYFYHSKTGKAIRHKGFIASKAPFTIGCGRIFSKTLLNRLGWKPWGDQTIDRGLDITCSRIMQNMHIQECQLEMKDVGIAVDIKTAIGLTNMETFNFNCEAADPHIFDLEFPDEMNKIKSLPLCHDISSTK